MSGRSVLLFALAGAWLLASQAAWACRAPLPDRARIGLVLSGGGSKAGAHIGVLRALEALQVPVDCIAGTSAGAIIGSLYAVGKSPDEIAAVIADIDWDDLLDDRPKREALPFRRKLDGYNYLVKYRPGLRANELALPPGLVQGQEIVQFLRRQFGPDRSVTDFDRLDIPLRIVATDLETGRAVVLADGDLAMAVRASMSIPVYFAPVELGDRRLIDGGIANNLPVDVARTMGADVIIAVDITTPLMRGDELSSALSVTEQVANILTRNNVHARLASLQARDVLITPDLAGIHSLDFEKTLDSQSAGFAAANEVRDALAPLRLSEAAWQDAVAARRGPGRTVHRRIERVVVDNDSGISDALIRRRFGVQPGDPLDVAAIEAGIVNLYGLDLFQLVDYRITTRDDAAVVHLDARAREWGPNYLQFGLLLSEDLSVGSDFNLGAAYLRTAINELGGEWRVQLDLGELQGLSFDWYQPISERRRHFFELEAQIAGRSFQFFEDGTLIAGLRVEGWGTRLSLGTEFGTSAEARLGWNYFAGDARATIGTLPVPDRSVDIGEFFAALQFDTLDNLNFPRSGTAGGVGAYVSRESAGAKRDFEQIIAAANLATSFRDNTLLFGLEAGTTIRSDAPLESQFLLGGLGRLSGYARNRFAGQHYTLASLTAFRQLSKRRWAPTYAGFSLEVGNVYAARRDVDLGSLLKAGSLFVGADTILGPVYFAWAVAEGSEDRFYLLLGNPFVRAGARPLDSP